MRLNDRWKLAVLPASILLAACGAQPGPGGADDSESLELRNPAVSHNAHSDVSPPLNLIPPVPETGGEIEHPVKPIPRRFNHAASDPVRQSSALTLLIPALSTNFDGVGNGFTGPAGTFQQRTELASPPATCSPSSASTSPARSTNSPPAT